jgi:hypothetical protein
MARRAFYVTRGTALANGQFGTSGGANTPISASFTAIAALQAAVDDAQAAAEADETISGNPTALGLVEDIGTAFAAYVAAVTAGETAASGKDVILDLDDEVITSRAAAKASLDAMMQTLDGSGIW